MKDKNSWMYASARFLAVLGIAIFNTPFSHSQSGHRELIDEEVIVTAERKEESIQDVAGVVQAFSAEDLAKDGINEVKQLQIATPGLSIANQEGNVEIFIRGVGSANNTELGDPGAAPHINNVYIPRPRGLGGMFYDLDRVEINKGPQGTLYGRNALAGTLNILTKRPNLSAQDSSNYIQVEAGNRSSFGAEGGVDININESNAFRLSGFYRDQDFGFTNILDNDSLSNGNSNDPAGLQEDRGVRLSFLSEPTERLSIFAMADWSNETGTGYPGANVHSAIVGSGLRTEDLNLKEVAYRGPEGDLDSEIFGFQTNIKYDFDGLILDYNGSYRELDYRQTNASSDGINYPGRDLSEIDEDVFSSVYWTNTSESHVHELRLVSDNDSAFQWSTGLFYFQEDQTVGFFSVADKGFCCFSGTEFTFPDVQGESFAIYGDVNLDFSDTTRMFAGLRFTDEEKSRDGIGGNWTLILGGATADNAFNCCIATRLGTEGFEPTLTDRPSFDAPAAGDNQAAAQFLIDGIATPGARDTLIDQIGSVADGSNPNGDCFIRDDIDNGFNGCPENGSFSFVTVSAPTDQEGSSSADFWDWRIGIEHDLTEDTLVYGKISTGHKAGGFNDSFDANIIPEEFEPENIIVYEAGLKNSIEAFGLPGILNVSGFYYDYQDQVVQDLTCINFDVIMNECNGFALANRNLSSSEIIGFELDSTFNLPANFSLDITGLALHSRIKEGVVADTRGQDFGAGGITPQIDLTGNRLPLQSDLTFSTRLQHEFDIGNGSFDWQILAAYRSSFFLTQFNERNLTLVSGETQTAFQAGFPDKQEGFWTVNLGFGYTTANDLRIEAFGKNIFDVEASQKEIVGSNLNIRFLNDARQYGVRLAQRF